VTTITFGLGFSDSGIIVNLDRDGVLASIVRLLERLAKLVDLCHTVPNSLILATSTVQLRYLFSDKIIRTELNINDGHKKIPDKMKY